MKISLSGRVIEIDYKYCEISVFDFLKLAKRVGYEAVEFRPTQINYNTSDEDLNSYKKMIDELGLEVSCIIASGVDEKDKSFSILTKYVDIAKLFNCSFIKTWNKNIEWLRIASEHLNKFDINLMVQNHTGGPFETVDGIIRALKEINKSNFGLQYDAANIYLAQNDYGIETIKKLHRNIFQVSIQNIAKVGSKEEAEEEYKGYYYKRWPLGKEGGLDYNSVFQGLKEIGFDGYITINEARSKEKKYDEFADYMFKELKMILGGVEER